MVKTSIRVCGIIMAAIILITLLPAAAFADGGLPEAGSDGRIVLTEDVTLSGNVTLTDGQTLVAGGFEITGGGYKITLEDGAAVTSDTGNDLYAILSGPSNYAVVYSDSGNTRTYELSDVICKNYDVYMGGHAAVIEKYGDNEKNLLISYAEGGSTYYLRYENDNGCAAVVYGGVKDKAVDGLNTSLTLKSGTLAAMVAGSKVSSGGGSVNNAVINIEGGSVVGDSKCSGQPYASQGMVMAVWYWGPDVENFTFNMTGGKVVGQVFGGSATSTAANTTAVTVNNFVANISGGMITGDLFAGAQDVNTAADSTQTVKNAQINISGSASVTSVFGGGFANWNGALTVVEKSEINLNGGNVGTIYGGGQNGLSNQYNNSATSKVDDVTININSGEVIDVYGGGYNFHWVNSYWVADDGSVIKVDYQDNPLGEMYHYSDVTSSTINVNGGTIIGEVSLGGRSWAHVGTSTANINADVDSVSGLGNYGYVENSNINVSAGASVGTLDLVRSGIVGNSTVTNNGSIGTLIAGAPANRYVDNMGVNKVGVLGDVVISGDGTVDKAELTYGLELADSVTSNVPLVTTAVPYGTEKSGSSTEHETRDGSDWSGTTVVLGAGTTFKTASGTELPNVQFGDGTEVKPDSDGSYSGKAAKVGDIYYPSLAEAITAAAANGKTVTLLSDITDQGLIEVSVGKTLTIDLNGFDIGFAEDSFFKVDGGKLHLTGSGKVYEQKPYDAPVKIWGSTTDTADYSVVTVDKDVTLEGWAGIFITVNPDGSGVNHAFGVEVTVNGTIYSVRDKTGYCGHGVYINGMNQDTTGNVPQIVLGPDSKIISEGTGIYAAGYAEWELAGDVTGTDALSLKSGTFNITGGTYHSTGEYSDPAAASSNGTEDTGAALSLTSNDDYAPKLVVNVSGGTFISDNGYAVYEGIAEKEGTPAAEQSYAVISITGGTFTGNSERGAVSIRKAGNKSVISGGTFSSRVDEYLTDSVKYELERGEGESFSYFQSFAAAEAAMRPGYTIRAVNVPQDVAVSSVTLRFNDDSTSDICYEVENGTELSLPSPERDGYSFNGWKDGSTVYAGGSGYTVYGDAVLNALWSRATQDGGNINFYSVGVAAGIENGTIKLSTDRASSGAIVTITAIPDAGYRLGSLKVTGADGKSLELTEKGEGKYSFSMPSCNVTVSATFTKTGTNPFTDVSAADYYYDAVLWAVDNGITNGTGDTTFSPNMSITRAQMVTFLWRAAGSPKAAGSNPFTDVSASDYYYDAVLWAVEKGITNGTSDTAFSPNMTVTRAQAVTFLWRSSGSPAVEGSSPFTDVDTTDYYFNAVLWAVENGITNGTSSSAFSPNTGVTRAQAVTFLYRDRA